MTAESEELDGGKISEERKAEKLANEGHVQFVPFAERLVGACVVAVYDSITRAERALHILHGSEFPHDQMSLVMSHIKDDPDLVTDLKLGQESAKESAVCAGLGGVVGFLSGIAVAVVTGIGTVFLLGPITGLFGGAALGTFVGAMAGLGIRREDIGRYEQCVKDGKVLVIAHGESHELDHAKRILNGTDVNEVKLHSRSGPHAPH